MNPAESSIYPVSFTRAALEQLMDLKANLSTNTLPFLRVGIKGGGCSGVSYLLAFDHMEENDKEYEIEGVRVVISKLHAMHVFGLKIDWENTPMNKGFVFLNPNEDFS